MQNLNIRYSYRSRLGLVLLGVGIVLTNFHLIGTDDKNILLPTVVELKTTAASAATTIAYPVSGQVEAGKALTLYAKRSGFVEQLSVKDGDVVAANQIMLVAVDPSTRARLGVQDIAATLNQLKADSTLISAKGQQAAAAISLGQSITLGDITNTSSQSREEAALKQLQTVLLQVEAAVPQALRFVQDNKSLFNADSMSLYTDVVEAFYGQEPNYLRIGFMNAGSNKSLLKALADTDISSSSALIAISNQTQLELNKIINLYQVSESEFFDKDQLASTDSQFVTYSEFRNSIAELSRGLVAAIDGAATLGDGILVNNETIKSNTAQAMVNQESASGLFSVTEMMASVTGSLSEAERGVLVSELELGLTTAPFSGVVSNVLVEVGQYVEAGQPLLSLSGDGDKEMKIKVEGAALGVAVGDAFLISGKTVGKVDRVVSVLEAGSATAYVAFSEPLTTGLIVQGELMATARAGLYNLSRDFINFDSVGPYVLTKGGDKIYLKIIHDNGQSLTIEAERELSEELVAAYGVRL